MKKSVLFIFFTAIIAVAMFSCGGGDGPAIEPDDPNAPKITITTQPAANTNVIAGRITGSLNVSATVTDDATLSYQWYSNTSDSNTGGTLLTSEATSASFAIPATLAAGTYYYFCEIRATDGAKSIRSNVATVTVTVAVSCNDPNFTGCGTSEDPFLIGTAAQLAKLSELLNASGSHNYSSKYYKLTADISLSAYGTAFNGGKGWIPIGVLIFEGHFDGNNHKVSGLYINDGSLDYKGLFGTITDGGSVSNLGVSGTVSGRNNVGGLAGRVLEGSNITNCYSNVVVSGSGGNIGGLVGTFSYNSNITNCHATGEVKSTGSGSSNFAVGGLVGTSANNSIITNSFATGEVSGIEGIGGLVGIVASAHITNCYATGAVNGGGEVGGVAGVVRNDAIMTNCFATGTVIGGSSVGGVAGSVRGDAVVANCYATSTVTGSSYVGGVAGRIGSSNSGSVTKCYATGTVSGQQYVGGVAGSVGYDSSVTSCAALNPRIERTTGTNNYFGRVAGYDYTVADNVAWEYMVLPSGWINGENGFGITTSESLDKDTYSGTGILKTIVELILGILTDVNINQLGWKFGTNDDNPWKMGVGDYKLPVFYWQTAAPAAMPEHLR